MIKRLLRQTRGLTVAATALWIVVGALALRPGRSEMVPSWAGFDKVMHFGAFAVLAAALWWTLVQGWRWPPRRAAWVVGLTGLGYGVAIELVQLLVPNRTAEVWDVVADALGVLVGIEIARRLERWAKSSDG